MMPHGIRFAALLGVFVFVPMAASIAGEAPDKAFYVAPSGSDTNPGTQAEPFKSIEKARDAVRGTSGDAVVYIAGGTYALEAPIRFDARDSGRNGCIAYVAADGEAPVLSGGRKVGGWVRDEGGRWKAAWEGGPLRQLYVNGVRAVRARGPVPEGIGRYGDLKFIDGDAGHTLPQDAMANWRNPNDIEFDYYNSWGHMICKVASVARQDGGGLKIAMLQPWFTLASRKEGVQAKMPDYIENALELLDEPGEWYLDAPAKTLYYQPRDGESMDTAEVVAPVLETLVEVDGTLDAPVENLRFEGITFADATWLGPNRTGHVDVQANVSFAPTNIFERDGVLVNVHNEYLKSPGNVTLRAVHAVRFERCTFTRLGGAALDIDYGSQDNMLSECRFFDISGSGVQIGNVLAEDHHPSDPRRIVKGNRVEYCEFHHIGAEYQDSVAVFAGYVNGTVIAHNEIHDLPYSGISVGWGWGEEDAGGGNYANIPYRYSNPTPAGNNLIEFNHIHDVMLLRNDGGGIYTLSNQPGTIIRGNHIHDSGQGGGPGGIYLDEGSGFIEITGNCVYNVPTPMNYNNRAQDRIKACNEHDNFFGIQPGEPGFPEEVVKKAGKKG